VSDATLEAECSVFTRYLTGLDANSYVQTRYRIGHTAAALAGDPSPADARLLAWAQRHPRWTELSDAFAALCARDSRLRSKLVLLFAILETVEPYQRHLDRRSRMGWVGLGLAGVRAALVTTAAVLCLGPGHLRFRGDTRPGQGRRQGA